MSLLIVSTHPLAHDGREQVLKASQFSMFNKYNFEPVTVPIERDR